MNSPRAQVEFFDKLRSSLENDIFRKLTLSKPVEAGEELKNIYGRVIVVKRKNVVSFTLRYQTKDVVKNFPFGEAIEKVSGWLGESFLGADLMTTEADYTLSLDKSGKAKLKTKEASEGIKPEKQHNREKKVLIDPAKATYLKDLGIADAQGVVLKNSRRKFKQINKFIEIVDSLLLGQKVEDKFNVVDVGSGKGYLTFALYDYLKNNKRVNVNICGIELRNSLTELCSQVAAKLDYSGLTFQAKDIHEFKMEKLDLLIALHACDTATDIAIAKGIQAQAQVILVAPCCHKQIRKEMHCGSDLAAILKHGILEERQAELITDGIRALLLEAHGYKTKVFEFISTEHTSKNLMIAATRAKPNKDALAKIDSIKKEFGIGVHYLETLLEQK